MSQRMPPDLGDPFSNLTVWDFFQFIWDRPLILTYIVVSTFILARMWWLTSIMPPKEIGPALARIKDETLRRDVRARVGLLTSDDCALTRKRFKGLVEDAKYAQLALEQDKALNAK